MGVIAISLALIVLLIILYFICKNIGKKNSCCQKVAAMFTTKLFYNGLIRYVIVGYLKLLNQFGQMFLIAIATMEDPYNIPLSGLAVLLLMIWPVFTAAFLIRKRNKIT